MTNCEALLYLLDFIAAKKIHDFKAHKSELKSNSTVNLS